MTVIMIAQVLMTLKMMAAVVMRWIRRMLTWWSLHSFAFCWVKIVQLCLYSGGKWKVICVLAKHFLPRMFAKRVCTSFAQKFGENEARKPSGCFLPMAQNYGRAEPGPRKTEKMQFMDIYTSHFCLSWQFKCWWWRCIEMKVKKLWQKDEMKNSPDRLDWTWQ